jgi:hypothetical protein
MTLMLAEAAPTAGRILCIACLEARRGRKLQRRIMSSSHKLDNDLHCHSSRRSENDGRTSWRTTPTLCFTRQIMCRLASLSNLRCPRKGPS